MMSLPRCGHKCAHARAKARLPDIARKLGTAAD
jgi:hypothetical protein